MFTGIIEAMGRITEVKKSNTNLVLIVECKLTSELKVDQSLSHNGVCLTVEKIMGNQYQVTAIKETLDKSNLNQLQVGDWVNLERCLRLGDRLDGHIVQGHVDQTGEIEFVKNENGSYLIGIKHEKILGNLTVEKGSTTVNGVSLTAFNSKANSFCVAIVPYTWENTNMKFIKAGDLVNLEFDILGKYAMKMIENKE